MRDLAMTCVLKVALTPHALAMAEVSAGFGALALLGVAPRHGVPKDAGFTALARTPCEVTANWALFEPVLAPANALPFLVAGWLLTPMRRSRRESTALARDQRKAHHEVGAVSPVAQLARPTPGERGLRGDNGVITIEFGAGSFHLDGLKLAEA
jgi:hypothetical protein